MHVNIRICVLFRAPLHVLMTLTPDVATRLNCDALNSCARVITLHDSWSVILISKMKNIIHQNIQP